MPAPYFKFRSNKQIYAQVGDDTTGRTLAAASIFEIRDVKAPRKKSLPYAGELIAKIQEAGVQAVVFDRNGYLYHGRIEELG